MKGIDKINPPRITTEPLYDVYNDDIQYPKQVYFGV